VSLSSTTKELLNSMDRCITIWASIISSVYLTIKLRIYFIFG